jgi:hypothetical protein
MVFLLLKYRKISISCRNFDTQTRKIPNPKLEDSTDLSQSLWYAEHVCTQECTCMTQREPHASRLIAKANHLDQTNHLHPSLRDSFTPLPPIGTRLTQEQLLSVFGGDLRVLRDLWRLVRRNRALGSEPCETNG